MAAHSRMMEHEGSRGEDGENKPSGEKESGSEERAAAQVSCFSLKMIDRVYLCMTYLFWSLLFTQHTSSDLLPVIETFSDRYPAAGRPHMICDVQITWTWVTGAAAHEQQTVNRDTNISPWCFSLLTNGRIERAGHERWCWFSGLNWNLEHVEIQRHGGAVVSTVAP